MKRTDGQKKKRAKPVEPVMIETRPETPPVCRCREPVGDRAYGGTWACRACGWPIEPKRRVG